MKKYKLLKTIVLGFISTEGHGEQYDALIDPKEGTYLECDGSTIWLTTAKGRYESTTTGNAPEVWTEDGLLEEIE